MGTAANIIMGGAKVYYAPTGETLPADSVAYGTAWGGNWVEIGYTNAPLAWAASREIYQVRAQQTTLPIKGVVTEEGHMFETTLSEVTATNLQLALGGTATTTAAGAAQVGKDELEAGGEAQLDERAWGFEGLYVDSSGDEFPVRCWIYRGISTVNGNLEFAKESEVGIPLQIMALEDTSQAAGKRAFKFQRVTASTTA